MTPTRRALLSALLLGRYGPVTALERERPQEGVDNWAKHSHPVGKFDLTAMCFRRSAAWSRPDEGLSWKRPRCVTTEAAAPTSDATGRGLH